MINDAGKHGVKGEGFVSARRQGEWAPVGRPDGARKMRRRVDLGLVNRPADAAKTGRSLA